MSGVSIDSRADRPPAKSVPTRKMTMSSAAAWIGDQKLSEPKTSEWGFYGFLQKPIACKFCSSQNDVHAFGDGMGWLSKIFGFENC